MTASFKNTPPRRHKYAPPSGGWRPFAEARDWARSLGLRSRAAWFRHFKAEGGYPDDLPADPARVYKGLGWEGWGDWLGTGEVAPQCRSHRPFEEARAWARSLGLGSFARWRRHLSENRLPPDIPAKPDAAYSGLGWAGWGDWLGTGAVAPQDRAYRPFEAARAWARSLGLKSGDEWYRHIRANGLPPDIPTNPHAAFRDHGWLGMGDWLGVVNCWNRNNIISFLNALGPNLSQLSAKELLAVLRGNGIAHIVEDDCSENRSKGLLRSLRDLTTSPDPEAALDEIVRQVEAFRREQGLPEKRDVPDDFAEPGEARAGGSRAHPRGPGEAAPCLDDLRGFDRMIEDLGLADDPETVEFLIASRVQRLWQAAFAGALPFPIDRYRAESGDRYFAAIRERFLDEYDGSTNLAIPPGWTGEHEPSLMQRLTAYRVLKDRRVGNWSKTGAGKTLSAILAALAVDSPLTVVVAHNSTIGTWREVVDRSVAPGLRGRFVVLNYEKFSHSDASLRRLSRRRDIGMVVLDEIQMVKRRQGAKAESLRRRRVSELLAHAAACNPGLCVLGMTATPVINDLREGKALLELITGEGLADVSVKPTESNAIYLHQKLLKHGLRHMPEYPQEVVLVRPEIDGLPLVPELVTATTVAQVEGLLVRAKVETILPWVRPGTLIYSHYVTGAAEEVHRVLRAAGIDAGLYTGRSKEGMEPFREGRLDVLVASAPIGTGVDGLQKVCDRLIFLSLPWTGAEYEQLVGRIHRQGSAFSRVEIIVPRVVIRDPGGEVGRWSWDELRWERVQYKRTLADAAVDGKIFGGELRRRGEFLPLAIGALADWIARVEACPDYGEGGRAAAGPGESPPPVTTAGEGRPR